jgi:CP family cyanate transporter-like MFS transporter
LQKNHQKILLFAAVILISLNLRPPLTGVGPLIGEIRADTGLSNTLLGLLTTIPILCFGVFSVFTALVTRRFGTEKTMAFALLLLSAGIFMRTAQSSFALFAGTVILGVGIAMGNVMLPGIVKKQFPDYVGWLTGIYSAMLAIGASLASGISVPLSERAGLGWRWALAVWGFFSVAAFISWLPQLKSKLPEAIKKGFRSSLRQLGSSKLAWHVAVFMGVQSLSFYILITWLPEILIDRGMGSEKAGWYLALMQAVGVTGTLLVPAWSSNRKRQQLPVAGIVLLEIISLGGLMIPSLSYIGVWISILGFCMGASFGMALLFIVLRSRDSTGANELSGMSQSVGYSFAAFGPVLFGALYDISGSWYIPLGFLFLVSFVKLYSGWRSGDNAVVNSS